MTNESEEFTADHQPSPPCAGFGSTRARVSRPPSEVMIMTARMLRGVGLSAVWLVVFATVAPCTASATELAPGVLDAQWLVKNCGSVPQGLTGSTPSGIGAAAEAGACIGYLGALAETAPILNRVVPANAQVCTQGQVSPAGLAQVVLDYIKRRPEVRSDPRLVVSLAALAEKYPCR